MTRGTCKTCGREAALRMDGSIRTHRAEGQASRCSGSLRLPEFASLTGDPEILVTQERALAAYASFADVGEQTPQDERRLRAQIAAHSSWAATDDRAERTAAARAARDAQFLEQAGGDPVRADHLRKAHFSRMALKSAVSRRKSREMREAAEAAEAELRDWDLS